VTSHRDNHNKTNLDRIHRVQGQLARLEAMIAADDGTCEERVILARTIEKGMNSLITHLVECYIEHTALPQLQAQPQHALQDLTRVLHLMNETTPYKTGKKKVKRKKEPVPSAE
jgi:DNA-binding FrmR family transcriptional regulator